MEVRVDEPESRCRASIAFVRRASSIVSTARRFARSLVRRSSARQSQRARARRAAGLRYGQLAMAAQVPLEGTQRWLQQPQKSVQDSPFSCCATHVLVAGSQARPKAQ
jgi:hypothetical protein